MLFKVLVLAVVLTLAQGDGPEKFEMKELDHVYGLGFGHPCDAGFPSTGGCAIKEDNGKFLIIAPLNSGKKFVKVDQTYATGLAPYGCKFGFPSVDGCVIRDNDEKYVVLGPLVNMDEPSNN